MIVITGPGRSGTSLLARAYADAGMDPGGAWKADIRAGFERSDVSQLNRQILTALDLSTLGVRKRAPRIDSLPIGSGGRTNLRRLLTSEQRKRIRHLFEYNPINRAHGVTLIDWTKIESIVDAFGSPMRDLGENIVLCKDPQFCWTLPAWIAAGARLDHVIITVRALDRMLESRRTAGHLRFHKMSDARNAMIYAVGNVLTSVADAEIPHTLARFPDFIHDLEALGARLPVVDDSLRPALIQALKSTADPNLVGQ